MEGFYLFTPDFKDLLPNLLFKKHIFWGLWLDTKCGMIESIGKRMKEAKNGVLKWMNYW